MIYDPKLWVVVSPDGLYWTGQADHELHAWRIALGYPRQDEIDEQYKACGWYAVPATVTWQKPTGDAA